MTKEDSSHLLEGVKFPYSAPLEKLTNSCNPVSTEHAEHAEVIHDPCNAMELEEILTYSALKDRRPSIRKLLRKHSAVTLSDPYDEVQHKFSIKETLNLDFVAVNDESTLTQLLSKDLTKPMEPDTDKFLLGNNFFQSEDLAALNKVDVIDD